MPDTKTPFSNSLGSNRHQEAGPDIRADGLSPTIDGKVTLVIRIIPVTLVSAINEGQEMEGLSGFQQREFYGSGISTT